MCAMCPKRTRTRCVMWALINSSSMVIVGVIIAVGFLVWSPWCWLCFAFTLSSVRFPRYPTSNPERMMASRLIGATPPAARKTRVIGQITLKSNRFAEVGGFLVECELMVEAVPKMRCDWNVQYQARCLTHHGKSTVDMDDINLFLYESCFCFCTKSMFDSFHKLTLVII